MARGKAQSRIRQASLRQLSPSEAPLPGMCELCQRAPVELTRHHLIPRSRGGKSGPIAMICPDCHGSIHQLYDERTLQTLFPTVKVMLEDERIAKAVKFIARQPATRRITQARPKRR